MARTREAASKKKTAPPKQPSLKDLRQSAKDLGLKGYSRKTVPELIQMIGEAQPVQAPGVYDPNVEVLATGFKVTPTVEIRVDGQLEVKDLAMVTQEPPNVQALLQWLVGEDEHGYRALVHGFSLAKAAEVRQMLHDRYVQLAANGNEPE